MSNRPRHLQYRKNIYRKKRTKAIAVIIGVALVALFILFLVIGNALHKKTSDREDTPNEEQSELPEATDGALPEAAAVGAYALPLLEDGSAFSSRLSEIPEGADAVCIPLNSEDGLLQYRSELAAEFPFLKYADDASSLSSSLNSIKDRGLHASAVLYVPSFEDEDDLAREIHFAAWCSVAVEAIRAGVDDCLIIPLAAGEEDVAKLRSLAELMRGMQEDAVIGLAVPEEILSSSGSEALIAELGESYSFLAISAANPKEDDDVGIYVETKIARMQVQLIYHKMRVLLPTADEPEVMQSYIDTVKKYNVASWLFLP